MPRDELLELLDNFKGQFHSKARRLKLLIGKVQFVEVETHQIARNIQRMDEQMKSHKTDQTETGAQPELDEE